jgi:hypothetical protein
MPIRYLLSYFIFVVIIFSQTIEIKVIDDDTDEEIEGVFIELENKKYISNKDGMLSIPSFINVNSELTFKHVRYEDKIVSVKILLNEPSVYLTPKVFKSEVLVEADKYKPRNLKVEEGKIQELKISKVTIENISGLDEIIELDNTVNVDKTLDGKSHVNVLSSEEKEVNYRIQNLSLFEQNKNQNFSDLLIHSLISNVELNLSGEGNFLANVNAFFNTEIDLRANLLISDEEFNSTIAKTYRTGTLFSLFGINGSKALRKFDVVDRDREFNFDIFSNTLKFNTYQNYKVSDSHINHIFLFKSQEKIYEKDIITDYEETYIDGLSWESDFLTVNNEMIFKDRSFKNYSKPSISQRIDEKQFQNQLKLSKIIGGIEEGVYLSYQNVYLSNDYTQRWQGNTTTNNVTDVKHMLTVRKKFLPNLEEFEKRTVFNLELNPAYYNSVLYMENILFKFSMDLVFLKNTFNFYSELGYGRVPILNGQKNYFVKSLKLIEDEVEGFGTSKNILVGVKFEPKNWKFDLNYSNRAYHNFLYKIYSITEEFYDIEDDAIIEVFNLSAVGQLSKYFSTSVSAQYLKSEKSVIYANKPELLLSSSIIANYKRSEFVLLAKYEANRKILKLVNDALFQTDVENVINLSLKYSYDNLFDMPLDVLFSADNLLQQDKYLLNGFYNSDTKFYISLNYTLD